jgi:hypothetical protein
MKLKELKASLSKLSGDFDDTEVAIKFQNNGKQDFVLLAGVGFLPDYSMCVLVCSETVKMAAKKKTMTFHDGTPLPDSFDSNINN